MIKEHRELFPKELEENRGLILSDDIDSLFSCYMLNKINGQEITHFYNFKECRIFRDWLLSQDNLSLRDIENHLLISGLGSLPNLASSYAFFLSEFQHDKNNANIERALICLQRFIIHEFMSMYDFYPNSDSGTFVYSSFGQRL